MSDNVHIFGIRHHGPGSARSLLAALVELAPDCLLIEGPPDADDVLPFALEAEMTPPVALLVFVPDTPRRSVYYPFAEFSPEWQAIRYGLTSHVPVRFMDLPQAFQLAEAPAPIKADIETPDTEGTELSSPPAPEDQPHRQDPIGFLAEAAGYTDSERWWDHMVEHRRDPAGVFEAVLEAMSALRSSGLEFRTTSDELLDESLRERQREAWMRQTIRQAQKEGFTRIAVVCGAWHAPALAQMPKASVDAAVLKGLTKVKVQATWIPWTYRRLSYNSGYGAGIESPGWYAHLWDTDKSVSETWLTKVAHLLRAEDLDASPASIIEGVRLAETLTALRDRAIPGLAEMNEAAQAVFCFGSDVPLKLISQKLIVGEVLGSVPSSAPMPPLQRNLNAEQKRLRFPAEDAEKIFDFDLRKPNDLDRSHLLHRLALLGIPWGKQERTSGGKGTFHEVWRVRWQPEFAVAVIEAGIWGNTILDAVTAFANERSNKSDALPELTNLLDKVLLSGLPESAAHIMTRVQAVAAVASDVAHLMGALPPLVNVLRYGNVRKTDSSTIAHVVKGLVARICIGLPVACSSLDDDAAEEMYKHIIATNSAISLLQNENYSQEWRETLEVLANKNSLHGLIGGRATRLLLDAGVLTGDDAARRMGLAFSTASEPPSAAAWVDGFLRGSGLLLLHDESLWAVIDHWVSQMPAETFESLLPLLRRTFATFNAPERRQMGERVRSDKPALHHSTAETGFDEDTAILALARVELLLGVTQ